MRNCYFCTKRIFLSYLFLSFDSICKDLSTVCGILDFLHDSPYPNSDGVVVRFYYHELQLFYRIVHMHFYAKNDMTLGQFLELYCFRSVTLLLVVTSHIDDITHS